MRICVIGAGYVGLVTGACFAEMGNIVTCVDSDEAKIDMLDRGRLPIFERGLDSLVAHNRKDGRLRFTISIAEGVASADVIFIAVGTSPNRDGSLDLANVLDVAREIACALSGTAIIVAKSTVPVGTTERLRRAVHAELARRGATFPVEIVSNPEFLKEGAAVDDFMRPDRIVIGCENPQAAETMRRLYAPFMRNHDVMIVMGTRAAEMTKYAANAMLATRISFMNEIAALCDRLGVDVESVRRGIGSDPRIGYSFLYPGCGFGGSCLPKDIRILTGSGRQWGVDLDILEMVERRNQLQKRRLSEKIVERFGTTLDEHTFALWGLSFKPGTDDVREAPSVVVIDELISRGARVAAYDPVAIESFRKSTNHEWIRREQLRLVRNQYDVLAGASALLLITEWPQFRNPDFGRMKQLLRAPVIFDGRNQYDPVSMKALGFDYFGIGR